MNALYSARSTYPVTDRIVFYKELPPIGPLHLCSYVCPPIELAPDSQYPDSNEGPPLVDVDARNVWFDLNCHEVLWILAYFMCDDSSAS